MKILRKTLAMVTALMMICGCVTAHAADVTTPQKISSDTVLDVDGGIIITDVTDEFARSILKPDMSPLPASKPVGT